MSTTKQKKFANLLVPFWNCPFKTAEDDCPFKPFWKLTDFEQQLDELDKLLENNLEELCLHHNACFKRKLERGETIVKL